MPVQGSDERSGAKHPNNNRDEAFCACPAGHPLALHLREGRLGRLYSTGFLTPFCSAPSNTAHLFRHYTLD